MAGGQPTPPREIRTSGTADDARLLADLYAHNASRQMPQKGSSDQAVACLRRLGAGVVGSAAGCAFRFRPPRDTVARPSQVTTVTSGLGTSAFSLATAPSKYGAVSHTSQARSASCAV